MAVAVEVEDDVFFADLSKQISLLIMDDEEDSSVSPTTSVSLQVFAQGIHPTMQTSMFVQEQNYGKIQSKGTGVFIPQAWNSRRKNNNRQQGRHNNSSSKNSNFHRQFQNSSRGLLQQIPYNNSSYDSFNSRKFLY
ncbi:hypothetical protein LIER_00672 [Lithospermum erythrorhizon]|uniref:Uncharacterized protein n=1 Tax=Lithospermum erythrorhizon TaxID=34254 RepID=A0AAV3NN14_LITER